MTQKEEYFTSDKYMLVERATGKEVPMQIFLKQSAKAGWEKAYAEQLAIFIGSVNSSTTTILAFLIKNRSQENLIYGTYKSLAEEIGVSKQTIVNVFKSLREKDMLKLVRNGVYFVSPHVIRNGYGLNGAILISEWDRL